jgi:hypothetical protein
MQNEEPSQEILGKNYYAHVVLNMKFVSFNCYQE